MSVAAAAELLQHSHHLWLWSGRCRRKTSALQRAGGSGVAILSLNSAWMSKAVRVRDGPY